MSDLKRKLEVMLYPVFKRYHAIKADLISYPASSEIYTAVSVEKMKAYNKVRFHGAKKLFCYNPFVNLFFDTFGNAVACCRSHQNVLGSYPRQSIREIWFGENAQNMREHMLHNDLGLGCDYCKLQLESNRFQGLPSMYAEAFATTKTGRYPQIMEFELSNICNLECVMCSGRVSSAIRKNREKLDPLPCPYDDHFVEQLKEFIPHLRKAFFYGGEPFLIPVYYKIWDQIIGLNPTMELYAVTNGTVMNEKVENIIRKTNFNLIVSLDSLDKQRAESIRAGSHFDEVIRNISKFNSVAKRKVSISHTPMTINWFETPEIIDYCNKIDAVINLSYVEGPAKYALWSMLPEQLEEVYRVYSRKEWPHAAKSFRAKYNIKVFNELKQQVLFFKSRNEEILRSFSDHPSDWEKETDKIAQFFEKFKNSQSIDPQKVEKFIRVFRDILGKTSPAPWHLVSLKNISAHLADESLVHSSQFNEYLDNPHLLEKLFDETRQADFFKSYY